MYKTEKIFKTSQIWELNYKQIKNFFNEEISFFINQYKKLKSLWKIILFIQLIIAIFWTFSLIKNISNISFYMSWIKYINHCRDSEFERNNKSKCKEYAKTWIGKKILNKSKSIDEEAYVKKVFQSRIRPKDVLQQLWVEEKSLFKIKEDKWWLSMSQSVFLDNTLKESSIHKNRLMIDWYLKINTIWTRLEEKNIIYSVHPNCTWNWFNWTFKCWIDTDTPITIKLIYCENWKTIKNIFDECNI